MAPPVIDMRGERYGRLVVVARAVQDKARGSRWLCRCDCGNETTVQRWSLLRGDTRSCGCLQRESIAARNRDRRKPMPVDGKKPCPGCGKVKVLDEFRRQKDTRDGRTSRCRQCLNAGRKARVQRSARWRNQTERNLADRDSFTAESRDYVPIIMADPCAYCGAPTKHVDHIDAGGDSHWTNLTGACASCNSAKHSRSLLGHLLSVRIRRERDGLREELRRRGRGSSPRLVGCSLLRSARSRTTGWFAAGISCLRFCGCSAARSSPSSRRRSSVAGGFGGTWFERASRVRICGRCTVDDRRDSSGVGRARAC